MKLLIHVVEARGLPAMDLNGLSDPYAILQLGKRRSKTKVVKKNLNPYWDEKISFRVGDLSEELTVSVLDEDKYFIDDFLGQVKIPLSKVMDADNMSLGVQWYQLQPKSKKAKMKDCGEIRLGISLSHKNNSGCGTPISYNSCSDELTSSSDKSSELTRELPSSSPSRKPDSSPASVVEDFESLEEVKSEAPSFVNRLYQYFTARNTEVASISTKDIDISEEIQGSMTNVEVSESQATEADLNMTFDELLKAMEAKEQGSEMPANLPGGVLVDQSYVASPSDLNSLIFSPNSNFLQSLADLQGTTGLQTEPWRLENGGESLKRVCTYTKAATRLVKAVKATEEQIYLKADGKAYAVLLSVSTPDVPFGNTFRTEVLFCISPGPELSSNEPSSRLVISWRSNFLQSTMMKGMIENGARQGLKESYAQFVDMLSQNVKPVDLKELGSSKEQILASLQTTEESDWKLAFRYFGNFTVVSSVLVALYITVHILLANPSKIQGLEFAGLDLPDSVGELVVCGVLVLQGQRVFNMIGRYMQARKQSGSDHGVKAQGDGWLLTVALIEGGNLAAVDSSGFSDPYVVFTCNGKTKTSSIKFQTADPQWNEIFEFDAMDDPPSMMHVDVYDFDGPFDEAISLGHAEVNFVKSNLSDLADIWIPLQGKLAQACQSRLHLRIFLNNTKGNEVVIEYLTKMEKEVGKKLNVRSPQTNSAFQKIFSLPPEEFLINDFTCHLKRKLPMQVNFFSLAYTEVFRENPHTKFRVSGKFQNSHPNTSRGRLFLSPRIIGFYTNLFGHKTKFFFLWEDIEDIQVVSPSLVSMGSPALMIILRRGRGFDARHGAKSVDKEGRLKFQFQSFVSFNVANRTIMALWKARSLSPEQKVQIVEEESEERTLSTEESGSFLGIEDAKMSEVFSSNVPFAINSVMALFEGGSIEQRIMEKVGCVNYDVTPWISVKADIYQRQVHYNFDKNLSRYGGSVTSTQQKSPLVDKKGWVIEEVMTLQGIPLGDYFDIHMRFNIEDLSPKSKATIVQVSLGISWLKSTKHQKRITKNVMSTSSDRLKEICRQVEKELTTVR